MKIESKTNKIIEGTKMLTFTSFAVIIALLLVSFGADQMAEASGVFEINFSSFVDSFGRDLREDCCSWQNNTSTTTSTIQSQQQQTQPCDPIKCQLIIRICVKNYQTQIDPNQCTFGELSAQVMKPNEQSPLFSAYHYPSGSSQRFNPARSARSYQQQQPATVATGRRNGQQQQATVSAVNIHHQRMLFQQQVQQPQVPSYLLSQQQQISPLSRGFGQQQQQYLLSSGQPRALRTIAFHQPISFPFNFTWPGSFSLIIDAWFESPTAQLPGQSAPLPFASAVHQHGAGHHGHSSGGSHSNHHLSSSWPTTYDLYKKQLIMQRAMHGWLPVKNEWTDDVHKTDVASLAYSYRVTCQPNYYGDQCNLLCRPRDDVYGHYTCSDQGNVICLPGWQGSYCLDPICSPGCHKDQGNCSRPNECNCRYGWEGPSCEQCQRYPGCVHGTCNKPHECICQEGWGGLLCNEDLNFCTNHQPCKNGALCTNAFDSNGMGSYTCACLPGFEGKNCEKRLLADGSDDPLISVPPQTPTTINGTGQYQLITISGSGNQQHHSSKLHHQQQQHQNTIPLPLSPQIITVEGTTNQQQVVPKQQQQLKTSIVQQSTGFQPQNVRQQQQVNGPLGMDLLGPFSLSSHYAQQQPVTQQQQQQPLDSRVVVAYGIIIVCMVILVVLLLLRIFFERTSQRQWQQESSHVDDVATLQNHQNIYKSRTSLSTDQLGVAYGPLDSPSSSSISSSSASNTSTLASCVGNTSTNGSRSKGQQQQQRQNQATYLQQQQHYRSHYNLMSATTLPTASAAATGPLNPPPPYTISHNSQHLNSTYMNYGQFNGLGGGGSLTYSHHHPSNNHTAPLTGSASSTALRGASTCGATLSPYGQLQPAVVAAAPNPYGSTNSTYQSPYYVIYLKVDHDTMGANGNGTGPSATDNNNSSSAIETVSNLNTSGSSSSSSASTTPRKSHPHNKFKPANGDESRG